MIHSFSLRFHTLCGMSENGALLILTSNHRNVRKRRFFPILFGYNLIQCNALNDWKASHCVSARYPLRLTIYMPKSLTGCLIPGRLPLRFGPPDFPLTYVYDPYHTHLTFTGVISLVVYTKYIRAILAHREIRETHTHTQRINICLSRLTRNTRNFSAGIHA